MVKKINEMASRELDRLFSSSIREEIKQTKENGQSIAKYDMKKRMAYREYPDGRKVYTFGDDDCLDCNEDCDKNCSVITEQYSEKNARAIDIDMVTKHESSNLMIF